MCSPVMLTATPFPELYWAAAKLASSSSSLCQTTSFDVHLQSFFLSGLLIAVSRAATKCCSGVWKPSSVSPLHTFDSLFSPLRCKRPLFFMFPSASCISRRSYEGRSLMRKSNNYLSKNCSRSLDSDSVCFIPTDREGSD